MATTFVTCERVLALLRDDEDFRWEFASNGIDSGYVQRRLGLNGNPRSRDEQQRKLSTDELESMANALEQLVQGKCTTESVKKGLGNKAGYRNPSSGERLTHDLTHHMTGGICDTPGCYMGHKLP